MIEVHRTRDLGVPIADAEEDRGAIFTRVFIQCVPILDACFGALVVMAHLDVHHARDRIRAIGGGSAIL